jgi:hypothetical protein
MVAASGTKRTLYPIYFRWSESVASAVVLPAHGPPVKHILVIGNLLYCLSSLCLALCTIGSSIILFFLSIEISSLTLAIRLFGVDVDI